VNKSTGFATGTAVVLFARVSARTSISGRLLFVLVTALLGGGCTASPSAQSPSPVSLSSELERWTSQHGGLIAGSRQDRAERALARLAPSLGVTGRTLTIAVLDTDEVGAFGWRSGNLFVTRGLIDLVADDDDELAAAIAHEAGHLLLADDRIARASALDGRRQDKGAAATGHVAAVEDGEMAADAVGRGLLRSSSVPEDALPRLLNKLAQHSGTSPACRDHLRRRIARLTPPAS
jgi:Zn-dependent protease with chaperone function